MEDTEVTTNSKIAWICRVCGKESAYQKDNGEIPKTWEFTSHYGLRCDDCVKKKLTPQ